MIIRFLNKNNDHKTDLWQGHSSNDDEFGSRGLTRTVRMLGLGQYEGQRKHFFCARWNQGDGMKRIFPDGRLTRQERIP